MLGPRVDGHHVSITAVDPLAPLYSRLMAREGIKPPIQTTFANAEDLSCFFAELSFDLVHCRNALDHSFDPVRGIEEMLRVVKLGGFIVLRHFVNEAEKGSYEGFHQFNFCKKEGRFCIWNKSQSSFPEEIFASVAQFYSNDHNGGNSIDVIIKKTGSFEQDIMRDRNRVCEVLLGVVGYFIEKQG